MSLLLPIKIRVTMKVEHEGEGQEVRGECVKVRVMACTGVANSIEVQYITIW